MELYIFQSNLARESPVPFAREESSGMTHLRELADAKVPHRILISYGAHWFPWYMRRLAERPANVWFLLRSMVAR